MSEVGFLEFASKIGGKELAQPFIFANTLLVFEQTELDIAQQICERYEDILEK